MVPVQALSTVLGQGSILPNSELSVLEISRSLGQYFTTPIPRLASASPYVAQASLVLALLLPQPPECWGYGGVPLYMAGEGSCVVYFSAPFALISQSGKTVLANFLTESSDITEYNPTQGVR